jgi:hypothetical protein
MAILGLPTLFIVKLVTFMNSNIVNNGVQWLEADNITYPKVTVCHPRFFTKNAMKGETNHYVLILFTNIS